MILRKKTFSSQLLCLCIIVLGSISHSYSQTSVSNANDLNGIQVGAVAPDFNSTNQFDSIINLKSALQNGPVVLVFYRGQWCPFCNRHLSNLQDSLQYVIVQGATVIAISPEKTEYLKQMVDKTRAEFTLLYDENYLISESYGVLFQPDQATKDLYNNRLNANLSDAHNNDAEMLPIPATYYYRTGW